MPSEKHQMLYSFVLELQATRQALLPQTTGHLVHAMFLNLVKQFDPALSAHLHDMPGPRPFTLSSLGGGASQGSRTRLEQGEICALRITLLDGGNLWQGLTAHLLETANVPVQVGPASLHVRRLLSSSAKDTTGWVKSTDWQALVSQPFCPEIAYRFISPTAFSLGQRMFSLVPAPVLLWESLLRSWNAYAPTDLHVDRLLLAEVLSQIRVTFCDLRVEQFHYTHSIQKGFVGACRYLLPMDHQFSPFLATLAAFAYYAGVGYKTTMGMGQTDPIPKEAMKGAELG